MTEDAASLLFRQDKKKGKKRGKKNNKKRYRLVVWEVASVVARRIKAEEAE